MGNSINISKDIAIDTLQQNFQHIDLEIEEKSVSFDTLKIVSANCTLLYYPLGIYNDIEKFLNCLPKETVIEKQIKMNGIETYYIQFSSNNIEVLVGDDYCGKNNSAINIINAIIENDTIEFVNFVKNGITKQSFVRMLNLESTDSFKEIKVIEFISVLLGIWHYYTFDDNNILIKIEIKSDYVFE
ncbi:hypothetical protein FACS189430_11790 [Bacteroidia bacterium]|nr:hypothetical protein FACS189430_11790 [Bacteroidia bacterium]